MSSEPCSSGASVSAERPHTTTQPPPQQPAITTTATTRGQQQGRDKGGDSRAATTTTNTTHDGSEGEGAGWEQECGVCLGAIGCRGTLDCCDHAFCFLCIMRWSQVRAVPCRLEVVLLANALESNTCPVCKARFGSVLRQPETAGEPTENLVFPVELRDQKPAVMTLAEYYLVMEPNPPAISPSGCLFPTAPRDEEEHYEGNEELVSFLCDPDDTEALSLCPSAPSHLSVVDYLDSLSHYSEDDDETDATNTTELPSTHWSSRTAKIPEIKRARTSKSLPLTTRSLPSTVIPKVAIKLPIPNSCQTSPCISNTTFPLSKSSQTTPTLNSKAKQDTHQTKRKQPPCTH
ncbi:hypothetical protein Pelo_14924 [Pelomyxa schiedti]|nr:hypothetical protein Pelo_14924 [Pelomyxa schiedti]